MSMATDGLLKRIQMIDHFSVITSYFCVEPCAKIPSTKMSNFSNPFSLLGNLGRGDRDDIPLHAVEDVELVSASPRRALGSVRR